MMEENKVLVFKAGQEEYGVHINQVVSIERIMEINTYPNRPAHVLGVITVRDAVIPVVDMRAALSEGTITPSDTARIVIVLVSGQEIGLVVDAATDVIDVPLDIIQHPNLIAEKDISYLRGVAKCNERLIILLDIETLLEKTTNLDELRNIKNEL
ncbi:chemotaxis protein CheW [Neobacillus mesonae]|uniref:chemotaxis protein CheW n=1 Tax=Neobacillus mesonae TaxID=1193713 RepID=UPI00204034FC|nr:chemotaxis protein CheW [Neobacillus mesonae]MCM3566990.1 chemotaxis protein CheW [Neobacillus mesonae]